MRGLNICFHRNIIKLSPKSSLLPLLTWNTDETRILFYATLLSKISHTYRFQNRDLYKSMDSGKPCMVSTLFSCFSTYNVVLSRIISFVEK